MHDVGIYYDKQSRALEPGVVMTVEPEFTSAPDTKTFPSSISALACGLKTTCCAPQMPASVTTKVPKRAEEIEALMAK